MKDIIEKAWENRTLLNDNNTKQKLANKRQQEQTQQTATNQPN